MNKKVFAIGAAVLLATGAAQAEFKAFKVNGETVSVATQKAIYDRLVASGQPAGEQLERNVKNSLIQRTVLLQEAKKAKIENNPDVKFQIDEARKTILIQGLAQEWARKNPVSEQELRKAYDQEKAAYGDTEYQVRHILVKTEDQAKNLISRLKKGSDFGKLAQEFSEDTASKAQGGLLGWIVPATVVPSFGATFSALKAGELAQEPVRTQFGFHVVKLEAKRKAQLFPSYDQRKGFLRTAIANQKNDARFQEILKKAEIR
ncbi:peptidylprolyl isomerase [Sutterella sp.]|uniref:peptidylprolyl isomerase n=1 Tax=Sutterella sp. TaxID=1981025 RepID=UPI0026DF3FF8|nr:peptidylprolyl isomerase [Sutterella sp.]MDO5530979.1 peptidylprolyl isomerase [Sutterella sp.]